jgi:hypothetical protein
MPRFTRAETPIKVDSEEVELSSLDKIALDTGIAHGLADATKKVLAEIRKEFFNAITIQIEAEKTPLAKKTVAVPTSIPVDDASAYALKYNPGWRLVESRVMPDGSAKVIIEEDPAFRSYSHIVRVENPDEGEYKGYHVSRSVVSGSVLLDDERLKKEDKALWEEITYIPMYESLANMLLGSGVDPEEVDTRLQKYLGDNLKRILKPLTDLTAKQQKRIKPYMYEGPKTLKLLVREAKDAELAGL